MCRQQSAQDKRSACFKAMTEYREFQFSWLMVGIMLAVEALICFFYITQLGDNPVTLRTLLILSAFFLVTLSIFYGMTTTVKGGNVRISFGIGLIWKNINLKNVASVEVVNNPWYYGYGIRLIPGGWLYNVSGLRAVELRFHDRKGVVRIGTKQAARLRNAIVGQS